MKFPYISIAMFDWTYLHFVSFNSIIDGCKQHYAKVFYRIRAHKHTWLPISLNKFQLKLLCEAFIRWWCFYRNSIAHLCQSNNWHISHIEWMFKEREKTKHEPINVCFLSVSASCTHAWWSLSLSHQYLRRLDTISTRFIV